MGKGRLEAFSDGVIAIIITVMVLELKTPDSVTLAGLAKVAPHLAIYAMSFVYVGIYWNNHHHLFQAVKSVDGRVLWANLHLLFWLSLTPFTSAWMGESDFAGLPVALYGGTLFMSAIAYSILVQALIAENGKESLVARAIGKDAKGWASVACYVAGIAVAAFQPLLSVGFYGVVALIWLVPDQRIARVLK